MRSLQFFQHSLLTPKFYRAELKTLGFYLLFYNVLYTRKSGEIPITDLKLELGSDIDDQIQELCTLQVIEVKEGIIRCPEACENLSGTLSRRAEDAERKAAGRASDKLGPEIKNKIDGFLKDWESIFKITTVIRNTVYRRVLDNNLPVSGFPQSIKFLEKYPEIKKRDPATWCDKKWIGKSWDELKKIFFPNKHEDLYLDIGGVLDE